ncbi:MAG TPA: hypothetical protein VK622_01265 [Puia sp.]|nr:hypothetical protein [Puia sp.]
MRNANRAIILSIVLLVLASLLPFQVTDSSIRSFLYAIIFFALVLSICWKVLRVMVLRQVHLIVRTLLIMILAFVLVCSFGFIWLGKMMCAYSNDIVLFENKANANLKIVERSYGCGAYDSDMPKYEVFKVRSFGKFVRYIAKTDTLALNRNEWTAVNTK